VKAEVREGAVRIQTGELGEPLRDEVVILHVPGALHHLWQLHVEINLQGENVAGLER